VWLGCCCFPGGDFQKTHLLDFPAGISETRSYLTSRRGFPKNTFTRLPGGDFQKAHSLDFPAGISNKLIHFAQPCLYPADALPSLAFTWQILCPALLSSSRSFAQPCFHPADPLPSLAFIRQILCPA